MGCATRLYARLAYNIRYLKSIDIVFQVSDYYPDMLYGDIRYRMGLMPHKPLALSGLSRSGRSDLVRSSSV